MWQALTAAIGHYERRVDCMGREKNEFKLAVSCLQLFQTFCLA
jgi:hypothetical protein